MVALENLEKADATIVNTTNISLKKRLLDIYIYIAKRLARFL